MTNSIASAKCPTVLSSGKYGMAQNRCADDSKEYIFVKLTDSAYRAVEEFKRFPNGQSAKIQIEGNSGFIQIPTPDSAKGDRNFAFTLDDVEGSLECIQQTSNGLDVLGSLSYRMRIHANDDIYDTTRTKMAIAEETEKSKCIREIKPNQTDIGRKVKKSSSFHHHSSSNQGGNVNSGNSNNNSSNFLSNNNSRSKLISPSNNSSHLNGATSSSGVIGVGSSRLGPVSSSSSRSPNPTMLGGSGTVGSSASNGGTNNNSNRYASHGLYSQNNANSLSSSLSPLTSASSLSSTFAGAISNGYSSISTGSPPDPLVSVSAPASANKSKVGSGNYGGGSNGRGNGGGGINGPRLGIKGGGVGKGSGNSSGGNKLPDISRRKIRERLIHLLALKPFKKPELYARLATEGMREREKPLISNVLKDVSTMSRDNTYNLRRQLWNDVNENWPFYTPQELQQLKRRKPQNLTPPISDAGSSTSGQSPTSTHTGSPPQLVGSGGNGGSGLKRDRTEGGGYDESALMGTQPKKQRISHFKKDSMATSSSSGYAGGSSIGLGGVNRIGGYSGNGGNVQQNKNVAYSPHGHSAQGADDNSHTSDLTFNVLDNVDDLMSHVEQGSSRYFGAGVPPSSNNVRKGNGGISNANNKNAGTVKEKRSAGIGKQQERTSNKDLMKKSSSPTPYLMNFVPESKTSSSGSNNSRVGANGVGTNNFSNNHFQHNSPNYSQQQHKSNSVMSKQTQISAPRDEANSSNRSSSGSMGRCAQPMGGRSSVKSTRTSAPPIQQQQQQPQNPQIHQQQQHHPPIHHQQPHHSQPYPHQSSQKLTSSLSSPLQQQKQLPPPPQYQQQQQLQQQHASPTQQIAAAASSYASAANGTSKEKPCYDFSNYTPITNIAQRRKYKTEFETDFDEYRKLLAHIEGVGIRFRELAEKLESARQGCADYDEIKQRIVSEYEKIQNEEALKNDKLRFDYLHAKLAHIKQSVTDYDNALAAVAAAAALQKQELLQQQQAQQQPQQQQHSAHIETTDTNNILTATRNSRLSPMISGGESNNSPPSCHQQQLPTQSQQQYASCYQQHHDAETIQQQHTHPHPETATLHHPPPPTAEQQSLPSPSNNINNNTATQQYQQQPHEYYNGGHHAEHQSSSNNNDCDSDSDDSSDSNSNDEDDSNSNSNSNEEDNDDDNDHY